MENRRQALEKCLNKITSHPILYRDPDLKLFMESDNFIIDVGIIIIFFFLAIKLFKLYFL